MSLKFASFSNCTAVMESAFQGCTSLTSVYLPKCMAVNSSAFYGCTALTSASLPKCFSVGSNAFRGCTALTAVYLPNVKSYSSSYSQRIYPSAFTGCHLASVTLGYDAVYPSIVNSGLGGCSWYEYRSYLKSVDLPNCKSIMSNTFSGCSVLETVSAPNCTYIAAYAFTSCYALKQADFPLAAQVISTQTFIHCSALQSAIFSSVTGVSTYAFAACSSLATLSLPACSYIAYTGILSARSIKTLNLGFTTFRSYYSTMDNVSYFWSGASAVYTSGCAIQCVRLGSCQTVAAAAFKNFFYFTSLYLPSTTMATLANVNAFASTPFSGYTQYSSQAPRIYVPTTLLATYKAAANWCEFSSYFSTI